MRREGKAGEGRNAVGEKTGGGQRAAAALQTEDGREAVREQGALSTEQMEIACAARRYLLAHLERRVTLGELTGVLHVSGTYLKTCFKRAYGAPLYAYIRAEKMRAAAAALRGSKDTVLEVAGRFGYDNGSKFAKAFRAEIGVTPRAYREKPNL